MGSVTETTPPVPERFQMPERFRRALALTTDVAMPKEFAADVGEWVHANKRHFKRGGDDEGYYRYNYELTDLDRHYEGLGPFHAMLLETLPEACAVCEVPEFDVRYIETHATLYHHGSHFAWHDDAPGLDGSLVATRRITFCYYLHTDPKMFAGGELEFLDGLRVEPVNNRLVMFHPIQQHQVRRVECWSAEAIHGRWALMGWVHGDPPPGYVDSMPELRGDPNSVANRGY